MQEIFLIILVKSTVCTPLKVETWWLLHTLLCTISISSDAFFLPTKVLYHYVTQSSSKRTHMSLCWLAEAEGAMVLTTYRDKNNFWKPLRIFICRYSTEQLPKRSLPAHQAAAMGTMMPHKCKRSQECVQQASWQFSHSRAFLSLTERT